MQNTFDFSFLATVKNNLSVSYPGHKGGTVSLWKVNKGQAGFETDCYENSQKRIAYRNYSLIPGRGRLCAKVQKEVLFPDGKLPHL